MLPPDRPASRIDYILVRGVGVAEPVATAVLFGEPAQFGLLSDHVGLLAEVAIRA